MGMGIDRLTTLQQLRYTPEDAILGQRKVYFGTTVHATHNEHKAVADGRHLVYEHAN